MYVKNMTQFNQQFKADGHSFTIRPEQTVSMTDAEIADHTTQFLLARGVLVMLDDEEGLGNIIAQSDEAKAKADEHRLEVNKAGEDTTKQVIIVQCAATTRSGDRCQRNVTVSLSEYSEDKPYFCGTHKNENPAAYEKVDGAWQKKLVDEQPSGDIDEVITDEEIAEALAEVMEEE